MGDLGSLTSPAPQGTETSAGVSLLILYLCFCGFFCLPFIQPFSGINSLLCRCQEKPLDALRCESGECRLSECVVGCQAGGWVGSRHKLPNTPDKKPWSPTIKLKLQTALPHARHEQMDTEIENSFITICCKKEKPCSRVECHPSFEFLWHLDLVIPLGHQGCFLKTTMTHTHVREVITFP